MAYIQYEIMDNRIDIKGTNEWRDLLVSLKCWSRRGWHAGAMKEAERLYDVVSFQLDVRKVVTIKGYSMGGAIGQCLAYLLWNNGYDVECYVKGSFPVTREDLHFKGEARIYGNDPVPALFPWFRHIVKRKREGPRRWFPFIFRDHVRY